MLYIFPTIVSTFLYYVSEINGFNVNNKNEAINEINSSFNGSEIVTESGSVMSKHKSLFHIIQNPREAPNLKSNIFDKMLSNEMLSIKQQIYDKSETNLSQIYITFKNSIATPTLELKQRWPIEKSSSQSEIKRPTESYSINANNNSATSTGDDKEHGDIKKLNANSINSKVLGVRSFDAMSDHHLERPKNHQHSLHKCTCMKSNPHTTCSFRCSEHQKKTCTHTENYVTLHPPCTRDMMSYTYYPYYVYPTMFLGVTTDPSVNYYHPEVINELKLPKHKYPKTRKPYVVDNFYYENDDAKYEKEYLENDYSYNEKPKITKSPRKKYKKGKKDRQDKIYFVDHQEENSISKSDTFDKGYLQVLDRDKFVEDVVEDLKMYYSDAVVKDCYCSLSSSLRNETLIICFLIPVFITIIK